MSKDLTFFFHSASLDCTCFHWSVVINLWDPRLITIVLFNWSIFASIRFATIALITHASTSSCSTWIFLAITSYVTVSWFAARDARVKSLMLRRHALSQSPISATNFGFPCWNCKYSFNPKALNTCKSSLKTLYCGIRAKYLIAAKCQTADGAAEKCAESTLFCCSAARTAAAALFMPAKECSSSELATAISPGSGYLMEITAVLAAYFCAVASCSSETFGPSNVSRNLIKNRCSFNSSAFISSDENVGPLTARFFSHRSQNFAYNIRCCSKEISTFTEFQAEQSSLTSFAVVPSKTSNELVSIAKFRIVIKTPYRVGDLGSMIVYRLCKTSMRIFSSPFSSGFDGSDSTT
mmetsp:Transcript_16047/g.26207  ORF Transcript_16047/g.26207 Transcript_16047/m.26207 type:complete len:351 (+) Transcript_16047:980-2032(+)